MKKQMETGLRKLLLVALLFVSYVGYSQEADTTYVVSEPRQPFGLTVLSPYSYNTFPTLVSESEEMKHYSTQVGMSAFTDFDGGYGFNTYVAPMLSYQLSDKWRVDFMGAMGATTAYNMPVGYNFSNGEFLTGDMSYNYLGAYAQLIYDITPKLYTGGSVYGGKAFNVDSPMNESMKNLGNVGASMFVGYKFSDSFKMEAEISINKRQSSPYGLGNPHQEYLGGPRRF